MLYLDITEFKSKIDVKCIVGSDSAAQGRSFQSSQSRLECLPWRECRGEMSDIESQLWGSRMVQPQRPRIQRGLLVLWDLRTVRSVLIRR